MLQSLALSLFITSALLGCRDGHFDNSSLEPQSNLSSFDLDLQQSSSRAIVISGHSRASHLEAKIQLKTRTAAPTPIRNQAIEVSFENSAIIGEKHFSAMTDETGAFLITLDLSPNEDFASPTQYEIKIHIHSSTFGDSFGILQVDLNKSNPALDWRESSKAQFEEIKNLDLRLNIDSEAFLKSTTPEGPNRIRYQMDLGLQVERAPKIPLAENSIKAHIASDKLNQDFELTTDIDGRSILSFEFTDARYESTQKFIALITIEFHRGSDVITKSKAVLIHLAANTPTPKVIVREKLTDLESRGAAFRKPLNVAIETVDVHRGRLKDHPWVDSDLQLKSEESLELKLRLSLPADRTTLNSSTEPLCGIPVNGQWLVVHSATENLTAASNIISHEKIQTSTDDRGELHLQTSLQYSNLNTHLLPAYIILSLQAPELRTLPTTYVVISEIAPQSLRFLTTDEANLILNGALITEPQAPVGPLPNATSGLSDKRLAAYLKDAVSLREVFSKAANLSKDRQEAVTQIQSFVNRGSEDRDEWRRMYPVFTKALGMLAAGSPDISLRVKDLLAIDELSSATLKEMVANTDLEAQIRRWGGEVKSDLAFDIQGRAKHCLEVSLWAGVSKPREEWTRTYYCNDTAQNFGPTTELYRWVVMHKTNTSLTNTEGELMSWLVRGNITLKDLVSPAAMDNFDDLKNPSRRGIIQRSIYP